MAKDLIPALLIDPGLASFAETPQAHLLKVFRPSLTRTQQLAICIAPVIPVCLASLRRHAAGWVALGWVALLGALLGKVAFGVDCPGFWVSCSIPASRCRLCGSFVLSPRLEGVGRAFAALGQLRGLIRPRAGALLRGRKLAAPSGGRWGDQDPRGRRDDCHCRYPGP